MESEGSLAHLQEPNIGPYPKTDELSPHIQILFLEVSLSYELPICI
jgi:hypothetical protein